jgi:hypothetical protein
MLSINARRKVVIDARLGEPNRKLSNKRKLRWHTKQGR